MSMDAGGLAQMTYNSSFNGGSLGVPGSGFASRGKGSHIKRLSVPPPSQISTIDESQPPATAATPRTSRSHLLAGLRTAPKSATIPPSHQQQQQQQQQRVGLEGNRNGNRNADRIPQTATGATFPQHMYGVDATSNNMNFNLGMMNMGQPLYSLPEQVLAPPAIDLREGETMDEKLYAELMSTNLFLQAQQQRLQQQLINVTQQFQNLNMGLSHQQQQQQQQQQQPQLASFFPGMSLYQQQLQQGMQPVVQPVPGQPGLYSVYNPMTGQQNFVYDNSVGAQQQDSAPPSYREQTQQSPVANPPPFRAEVSPPPESTESPKDSSGAVSPKNSPSPPQGATSSPSANAFRRGHKKSSSFAPGLKANIDVARANGSGPRSAGFPQTPATGTFGPGQGRAGEHPIRQPRGPPSLEELIAKPTSKHEGSKNFATRQRRRAVHSLVRAGIERRGESRSNHGSGGSNTPASETEFAFSSVSDGDESRRGSGSLSSKPSLGSLRALANGAIGSEMKEKDRTSRERGSMDSLYTVTTTTTSGEDSPGFGGKVSPPSAAAVVAGHRTVSQNSERRKTPMLVLSSAEKRKSPIV
ncbi:hypothetical protein VTN96DRAFT_4490 [Rasamsonia emersonii]|uniref:Uncharacterized protein n=1 Tax=Rasamsonia emersonii (strain ATCC 16479 / CBS 393.64 / IMI 116815) TaxID=1408163 RepID=A0A0F4YZJ4_RASE3|nr:hypothetical protein T310_2327 [Rasamsonia emersonii CBS 393.64]KKA23649.1 hypothetical protein T310_2327 [Rasamsonia emersonii CBS 393.64]